MTAAITCESIQTRSPSPSRPRSPSSSPCHSILPPNLYDTTNNMNHTHRIIDYDTPYELGPATSSNEAVFAMGCSSSTEISDSKIVVSPMGPLMTHSLSNPPRLAPHTGSGSTVIETTGDELDEDAYGTWWFFTSNSESFDRPKHSTLGEQADTTTNECTDESDLATKTRTLVRTDVKELNAQFVQPVEKSVMFELPSCRKSNPSSLRNNDVDLGGATLDHDHDMVYCATPITPYYNIPHNQNPSLSTSACVAKDMDLEKGYQSDDHIEWTPQDSSYGAAVPACGCVSKRKRKLFEGIMLVIVVILMIFVLVKAGVHLRSSGSGAKNRYFSDDDHYDYNNVNVENHDNGSNDQRGSNGHNTM
jgi:hypothetical protein